MNTNKGGQGVNAQSFQLPPEMNKVISATVTDTISGEILFCHDELFLFAAKIAKTCGNVIFQRFNLPNIKKIIPIIKNYFIALFNDKKMVIFEVWFNEVAKIMLKYIFNKNEKTYIGYFLREVVENMAQVHICYPQNEIYVYQFTVNGKVGFMNYVIGPQNKIRFQRQQLYGSKTIVCPEKKALYYFTNFSNKFVNVMNMNKLEAELSEQYKASLLAYVCIPKIEQHYIVMSNLVAVNLANNVMRYKINVDQAYIQEVTRIMQKKDCASFTVSTYFDMIMVSDSELNLSIVFQIKQKASSMIAIEYGNFNWFWTSTRKLIGLSYSRNQFKVIQNLRINQKNGPKQETIQFVIDHKVSEKVKQEKSKNEENICDDFLVKQKSKSNQRTQNKVSPEKNSQVHSLATFSDKKVEQQPTISQKPSSKQQVQETVQAKPPKFVPNKIIQKKGVSISKSLNKPKEIQPIAKAQQPNKKAQNDDLKQIVEFQEKKVQQCKNQTLIPLPQEPKSAEIKPNVFFQENEKNGDGIKEVIKNQIQNFKSDDYNQQKQVQKEKNTNQNKEQIINKKKQQNQNQNKQQTLHQDKPQNQNQEKQQTLNQEKQKAFNQEKQQTLNQEKQKAFNQEKQQTLNQEKQKAFNQEKQQTLHQDKPQNQNQEKQQTLNQNKEQALNQKKQQILNQDKEQALNQKKQQILNQDKEQSLNQKKQYKESKQEAAANQQSIIKQADDSRVNENKEQTGIFLDDSLSKNLALMIQKNNIAGLPSFSSSIDRNKIFSSFSAPLTRSLFDQGLTKIQSEKSPQEYYNPFLSQSPLQTTQLQKQRLGQSGEGLAQHSPTQSQIKKYNAQLIQKIKELFQTTTARLLKSIQEVGSINTSEAYLKVKVREEIQKKVLETLKNHVNGQLTQRLELYFKEVFRQTSAVQQQSIKFYKQAALHKTSNIEVQLNNQQKILKEIRDVQSMIRFTISELRGQTTEVYENLMSEWTIKFRQSKEIISNFISVKQKLEEESLQKAKRFEEIKKNLQDIKNKLVEKSALQEERKQKKLQEKTVKLKQKAEKKAKQQKKTQREKEKKYKHKKGADC